MEDQVEFVRADISSFTSVLRMVEKHRAKTIYHVGAEGECMKYEIQDSTGKRSGLLLGRSTFEAH